MTTPDLETFWNDTITRARQVPLEATCEVVAEPAPYYTYRVSYRSFGGEEIIALLGVPILDREGQRLPAVVSAPGYGGWEHGITLSECQRGYVVMQIFPRQQGESSGLPRYERWQGEGPLLRGIKHPEGYFYQGAYMDMLCGVDYFRTRADVAPERIGAMGTSQGGGIVLGSSAINPLVKAVVAHVPYFCDMRHNSAFAGGELDTPENLATFDYFDPVNLAYRLQAPTLLSSGGKDMTCPMETIRAVYDNLPGVKSLAHYPDLIHTSSLGFYQMSWEWMRMYL